MAFQDMADIAQHCGFQRRVRVAMVKTALAVGAAPDDPASPETSRTRRAHAVNVLIDQEAWAVRYAWAVVTNPVVALDSSDALLGDAIQSHFNAMAGAPPAAPPA